MSRKFEVNRDDLVVDPEISKCHQVSKGFRDFVKGTEPIKLSRSRPWTFHLGMTLVLAAIFAFLNRALFAWEWSWAESFPVFMVFVLSPIIALIWAGVTFFAFRERDSPVEPTHLLAGVVTKVGRSNNGVRSITVEYSLPEGGIGKAIGSCIGNAVPRGSRVAVLHYDSRKATALL